MASSSATRPAPQLLFDDGSRAILEEPEPADASRFVRRRPEQQSIPEYYEIDRLVGEIRQLRHAALMVASTAWQGRIALQFPDDLLTDAPDVCWEFEQRLDDDENDPDAPPSLFFVLGDTTYQSCCPDSVAAAHLAADCLVHYGHACLSSSVGSAAGGGVSRLPVLYSFGNQALLVEQAMVALGVQMAAAIADVPTTRPTKEQHKLLLLYQVEYAHAVNTLRDRIASLSHFDEIVVGQIPQNQRPANRTSSSCGKPDCCGGSSHPAGDHHKPVAEDSAIEPLNKEEEDTTETTPETLILGGLEIPHWDDWSDFTLLFVGQQSPSSSRSHTNLLLRFLSLAPEKQPAAYWTWDPQNQQLSTDLSSNISKVLNRRFFKVQKAKLARIFGIVVANLSDPAVRQVVHRLQTLLKQKERACYVFVVGKINPAKLANFPEVDVFCLVACPEHSLLEDRDFATPIVTPLELAMALEATPTWGNLSYSLEARDFLRATKEDADGEIAEKDDDEDAPYFNPVTGRYESSSITAVKDETVDLKALPGQGQLTAYQSAAADFLKQRTYQGLQVEAGETAVQAAVPGQQGIASNYGNR
jgi:diphthamide biosynthesis protein 2